MRLPVLAGRGGRLGFRGRAVFVRIRAGFGRRQAGGKRVQPAGNGGVELLELGRVAVAAQRHVLDRRIHRARQPLKLRGDEIHARLKAR